MLEKGESLNIYNIGMSSHIPLHHHVPPLTFRVLYAIKHIQQSKQVLKLHGRLKYTVTYVHEEEATTKLVGTPRRSTENSRCQKNVPTLCPTPVHTFLTESATLPAHICIWVWRTGYSSVPNRSSWSLTYFWGFEPALVSYLEPGRPISLSQAACAPDWGSTGH